MFMHLKDLVLRVERYLMYQLYHAQNTYPYPEDQNVAEWVREEGEPNGWTRFGQDVDSITPPQQKPLTSSGTENSDTTNSDGESTTTQKIKTGRVKRLNWNVIL